MALGVLAVLIAACGDGKDTPRASPSGTPAPHDVVRFCTGHGTGWRSLAADVDGQPVDAAALGAGTAVVLVNELDNDACAWMKMARELAQRHYRPVVFRYTNSEHEPRMVREALAVVDAARGSAKAQMVGSSIGGRIVFEAAAVAPDQLAAVASLSGELRLEGRRDIRTDVKRVHIPVLYLGSREDPLTDGTRQPRKIKALLRSADARVRIFDGSEHGVALFQAAAGNSVRRLLMAFLDAHR
jgi:pimeloyl-ACP methyl ester carboxylesterase